MRDNSGSILRALPLGVLCLAMSAVATARAEPDRSPQRPRNLIVISIDTLRADRLGCYGHDRPTSPSIDRLAREGVVFDDASATSPWTKPSHASLFTGLYPSRNGATTMKSVLREDVVTLAEHLGQHGYQTIAVVNSKLLQTQGLERGFRVLEYIEYIQGKRNSSPVTEKAVLALARRDREQPLFALIHYMDVHSDYLSLPKYEAMFTRPYDGFADGTTQQLYRFANGLFDLKPADAAHLLDLYDAGIRQVDDELRVLFSYLRQQKLFEDSLVVLLSDHGEEFLEHGSVLHGHTQYQEVIRIPLIFRGPGVPSGKRVAEPVSLVDVMPTCLELLDLPLPSSPSSLDGIAIHPLWGAAAEPEQRLLYSEADVTFPPPAPGLVPIGPRRAVRDDRYKLHYNTETKRVELYDLAEDPGETVNLADRQPETVERLRGRLERFLSTAQTTPSVAANPR